MNNEDNLMMNRFRELAERAFSKSKYTYSEFLTTAEQDVLLRMSFERNCAPFELSGGYNASERAVACFGSFELCGFTEKPPITCLCAEPVLAKFSDDLTHRDFLGALMSLGIRRSVIGDIVVTGGKGYIFCLNSVAGIIAESLDTVKHTKIKCDSVESLPEDIESNAETKEVIISSERLDSVVSAVYGISRSESKRLITQKIIFVNSKITENGDYSLSEGDIISVRGYGRFIFNGTIKETRKGKLRAEVRIYGKS